MGLPIRVLIVEDSADDCALMIRALERDGFEPQARRVETEGDMLEALAAEPWDVILSDYFMPQFDALRALATLRATALDLPFILVSGSVGEAMAVESMRAGMHDYIFKYNLSRLGQAVHRELREAKNRRDRREARIALYQAYAELQQRVEERTEELRVANLRLSRELEERMKAEDALQQHRQNLEQLVAVRTATLVEVNRALEEERMALNRKNIALQEMIGQYRAAKDEVRQQVKQSLREALIPTLERLALVKDPDVAELVGVLRTELEDAVSPFLGNLKRSSENLTARELEVCRYIKDGLSTKAIADVLKLSQMTVQKHRETIRKKLGITNEEVNLQVYLQQLRIESEEEITP